MLARPLGFTPDAPFMTSLVTFRQKGCSGSQSFPQQGSPIPSASMSDWSGLGTAGQLSAQSGTPSPSVSVPPTPGVQIPAWHELGPPQTGVGPQEVPSGSRWQSAEQ